MNFVRRLFGFGRSIPKKPSKPIDPRANLFEDRPTTDRRPTIYKFLRPIMPPDLSSIVADYAADFRYTWTLPAPDDYSVWIADGTAHVRMSTTNRDPWRRIVAAESVDTGPHRWRIRADFTTDKKGYLAVGLSKTNAVHPSPPMQNWSDTLTADDIVIWTAHSSDYYPITQPVYVFHNDDWRQNEVVRSDIRRQSATVIVLVEYDPSASTMTVGFRDQTTAVIRSIDVPLPTSDRWFPAIAICGCLQASFLSWPDD